MLCFHSTREYLLYRESAGSRSSHCSQPVLCVQAVYQHLSFSTSSACSFAFITKQLLQWPKYSGLAKASRSSLQASIILSDPHLREGVVYHPLCLCKSLEGQEGSKKEAGKVGGIQLSFTSGNEGGGGGKATQPKPGCVGRKCYLCRTPCRSHRSERSQRHPWSKGQANEQEAIAFLLTFVAGMWPHSD